ncbi:MAG: 50S ribosomal protein L22 [Candidatus Micrarchaeota archaeon]|nr:50S ribosomal protein L22 [Candidatus Micrarchaeota archaeon]
MIRYSYNKEREGVIFAGAKDLNASFKDLCAVCDTIRNSQVTTAMEVLERAEKGKLAILYRRHNRYMGDRHELGGKKGRWPKKCAGLVKKVLINAAANARNMGEDPDSMVVVHAAANKTTTIPRRPPKGIRYVRTGGYGYVPTRRSDLELAKIEIGLAYPKGQKKPDKKTQAAQQQKKQAAATQKKEEWKKPATEKGEKPKALATATTSAVTGK